MATRDKILEAVLQNQPPATFLPDISLFKGNPDGVVEKYMEVFKAIGGTAILVNDLDEVKDFIKQNFDSEKRIVTNHPSLHESFELISLSADPHEYENVELAIIPAHFAVAENAAVWLTEEVMGQRIIPYICQHLAVIVQSQNILPTLQEAYERIGTSDYGFGGFIAGPSKTADIEQALVLGAHGPLSMTVFILK